jgi:hypothetical protein
LLLLAGAGRHGGGTECGGGGDVKGACLCGLAAVSS